MNSLHKTAIIFLLSLFTVHCQDVVPETSVRNTGGEENNQSADYNVCNVYDEDYIYIYDAEDKNTDESHDNDRVLDLFECFIKKFNRKYSHTNEYNNRFQIFKSNLKKIKALQEKEKGTAKYGITKYSDLTENEFREMYMGCNFIASSGPMQQAVVPDVNIPQEFDWRSHGAVTDVKDQSDNCGSCWAFSTVGNIEGVWAVKHKELVSLSAQELVDCDERNHGCSGGWMSDAYKSIIELGGLQSDADYPYKGREMECRFNKSKVVATISDYREFKNLDEDVMAKWLVANAPVSVAINADPVKFYTSGVLHPDYCDPTDLNHGVVIVGYGVEESDNGDQPYWIIKNSWGSDWGEKGYLRLYRGDGTCGVNKFVSTALVEEH